MGCALFIAARLMVVQAACPRFLHGDIRLHSILRVSGGARGAARCVLLDFERSRLDGEKQQQRELAQLRQLLDRCAV